KNLECAKSVGALFPCNSVAASFPGGNSVAASSPAVILLPRSPPNPGAIMVTMTAIAPRPPVEVQERLYTAADLAELPSELPSGPVRYELDNGRLISMAPPGDEHGMVTSNLD